MDLKEKLNLRIKELEKDVTLYSEFVKDTSKLPDERKVVSFKLMFEMIALTSLADLADYTPSTGVSDVLEGLSGAADYVSVQDGKVVISPLYSEILKMKDQFLQNTKKN
jgi:hypothetical protein